MGILFLSLGKLFAIGKMIAMKKCGNAASGAENSIKINLIRSVGCVLISLIVCIFSGFSGMSGAGMLYSLLSGIANAMLLFTWVLCAERCSLCTVEIFCMIGGVVLPMILSPLLFGGEAASLFGWAGALLLLPAAYCFFPRSDGKGFTLSSLPLLLLAGISNAGCVISQKQFTEANGGSVADFNLLTFLFCTLTLTVIFVLTKIKKKGVKSERNGEKTRNKQIIIYIFIAIIMLYASQYLLTLSAGRISSRLFFPLSYAIAMPMTLLCDIIVFGERIRPSSVLGLTLVITSIILINI